MYCVDEYFFEELCELIEHHDWTVDEVSEWDEEHGVLAFECQLEPLVTITPGWIMDRISTDRVPEEGDEGEVLLKALNQCIDFESLNSLIPKLWYTTRKSVIFTKQEILDELNS